MPDKTDRPSSDEIFQILRDRICLLEYQPGEKIRETDLAKEFGISRTPIRAVIQKLSHWGMVESRDGVGTIVTNPDVSEIGDIYRMRMELAGLIAKLDPRETNVHDKRIARPLFRRAKALRNEFDIAEYWQINHEMHFLICDIIGNTALREVWQQLYFKAARFWYQNAMQDPDGVIEPLVDELRGIATAVEANDPVKLGEVQRQYIEYGLSRLEEAAK